MDVCDEIELFGDSAWEQNFEALFVYALFSFALFCVHLYNVPVSVLALISIFFSLASSPVNRVQEVWVEPLVSGHQVMDVDVDVVPIVDITVDNIHTVAEPEAATATVTATATSVGSTSTIAPPPPPPPPPPATHL